MIRPTTTPPEESATDYVYHWSDYDDASQEDLLRAGRSGQGDPSCPLDGAGQPQGAHAISLEVPVVPLERKARRTGTPWLTPYLSRIPIESVEYLGGVPTPLFLTDYAGWTGDAA
jgi:hypothetical protein